MTQSNKYLALNEEVFIRMCASYCNYANKEIQEKDSIKELSYEIEYGALCIVAHIMVSVYMRNIEPSEKPLESQLINIALLRRLKENRQDFDSLLSSLARSVSGDHIKQFFELYYFKYTEGCEMPNYAELIMATYHKGEALKPKYFELLNSVMLPMIDRITNDTLDEIERQFKLYDVRQYVKDIETADIDTLKETLDKTTSYLELNKYYKYQPALLKDSTKRGMTKRKVTFLEEKRENFEGKKKPKRGEPTAPKP